MKGGIGNRVVSWGVNLVLLFTAMVLLFGTPTTNSFGAAAFSALGDGVHVVVKGLPVMADHIKGAATGTKAPEKKADTTKPAATTGS